MVLLDRPAYLNHLKQHLSMSEIHAHRIESLYLKFNDKRTVQVLSSKPSILYLLASSTETKKISSLIEGRRVRVGSSFKSLSELTIKDVHTIQISKTIDASKDADIQDIEDDINRARNAHRRLATLCEELCDWSEDLLRFQKSNIEISNQSLIQRNIKETIKCLKEISLHLS